MRVDEPTLINMDGNRIKPWRLISTATISNDATLDFDVSDTRYSQYLLKIRDYVPGTDAQSLGMQFSFDGGATFDASGNPYSSIKALVNEAAGLANRINTANLLYLSTANELLGSAANESGTWDILLANLGRGSGYPSVLWETFYYNNAAVYVSGGGVYTEAVAPVTDIRLIMTSGNLGSGTVSLFGRTES